MDLSDTNIAKVVEAKAKIVINSDAHNKNHFAFLKFGIAQARRGWAKESDVVNTLSLNQFLKSLKK
jgi:DNA polymerase (family X)